MKKIKAYYKSIPIQVKASLWFLISMVFQNALAALSTPFFTRLMTTSEYGRYSVILSWQQILNCFITLNIYGGVYAQGLVKQMGEIRNRYISSFQGLLMSLVVGWFLIFLFIHQIIEEIIDFTFVEGCFIFILIWGTGIFQIWAQAERTEFRYKKLVIVSIAYALISTVSGLLLVYSMDSKVTARILGLAIPAMVIYSGLFIGQIRKDRRIFDSDIWNHTILLTIPLLPHYLSQIILNSSDRIMISNLVGENEAGIYSLAYTLAQMMTLFNSALLSTIEPWIYKNIKEAEETRKIGIENVAYISFSAIASMNILLIAFVPEIIKIFAPIEYYEAIWVIPPVSLSVFFMFIYSFFGLFEFYYEKSKYITVATLTGAILNIVLNYIFINQYGYIAAGYTTLICYMVYALMHYVFMKKVIRENLDGIRVYDVKIIMAISAVFIVLAFALMSTYSMQILRYVILIILMIGMIIKRNFIVDQIIQIIKLRKE